MSAGSSKTTLRSWLKQGRVSVDGKIVKKGDIIVGKGEEIAVGRRKQKIEMGIEILYKDGHIVVVNKPKGLLSVATAFEKGNTLHVFLKKRFRPKKVFVVHRLDQDTSGVMIFALSVRARDKLKSMFKKHTIERAYVAIVEGKMKHKQGTWKSYLYEDENYVVHSIHDPKKGRLSITHYEVIDVSKRYTKLNLKLKTGRKNQIRVHCKDAGHPVVGDKKYGAKTNPIKRLGLHAYLLTFVHPITQKKMRFESPVPESFHA